MTPRTSSASLAGQSLLSRDKLLLQRSSRLASRLFFDFHTLFDRALPLPRSTRGTLCQLFLHQPLQVFSDQRLVLGLFLCLQLEDPSLLFGRDDLVLCERIRGRRVSVLCPGCCGTGGLRGVTHLFSFARRSSFDADFHS